MELFYTWRESQSNNADGKGIYMVLFVASVLSLFIPWFINLRQVTTNPESVQEIINLNRRAKHWIKENTIFLGCVVGLTGGIYQAILLVSCNAFGLRTQSAYAFVHRADNAHLFSGSFCLVLHCAPPPPSGLFLFVVHFLCFAKI